MCKYGLTFNEVQLRAFTIPVFQNDFSKFKNRSGFNHFHASEESGVVDTLTLELKLAASVELARVQILTKCHCDGMGLYFQRKGRGGSSEASHKTITFCLI